MNVDVNVENATRIRVTDNYPTSNHGDVSRVSIVPLHTNVVNDIVLYCDRYGNIYLRMWDLNRHVVEIPLLEDSGNKLNDDLLIIGTANDGGTNV
jgi:hypothetical protein